MSPDEVARARRWLIGTLPVHVFNPPNALETRVREEHALRAKKRRWNTGIKWFLILGGGGFLLMITIMIMRSHGQMARETTRVLFKGDDALAVEERVATRRAARAVIVRGGGLLVTMALGLALAIVVLEKLVWEF
jgi:hypothetical protein